jgi:SWI2/SNF2 ATPase
VDSQKDTNLKKGVNGSVLKTLQVPVPPLAEQQKVAGVLGLVQRAMEQQERLLALTAELKKALLHQLFTYGLPHEPQKQTELGPIPQTEAIGFAYGVTWNTVRRNIFNWKHIEAGDLEAKVKSFCAVPQVLRLLKDFILFAEKEEELHKFILMRHQMSGADKVVARALDSRLTRGLVWHTQGSGKTYTMIKAAEMLFKAPEAEKPTIPADD